ncbi:MAG: succinyldiaminopimelate transaminase [Pseudomonadota bacterium]
MSDVSVNPGFAALAPYPFEKLSALLKDATPANKTAVPLSIGEPRHAPPDFVLDTYRQHLIDGVSRYPTIRGTDRLREACADWLLRRFGLAVDAETMVQPVNGTREALFAIAQAFVTPNAGQRVLLPNPFYQIYEGAALMAGAQPTYVNVSADSDYLPVLEDIPADVLQETRVFYLCSPVNPCGTIAPRGYLKRLAALAIEFDFIVAADECYIEIYRDQAPHSALMAAQEIDAGFRNVLTFHSLSKRSNLPGLRSGFVAGDARLIQRFSEYRTYHGCSMSLAVQEASIAAWGDDEHVAVNRSLYNQKYALAKTLLSKHLTVDVPPATFYLWPNIGDDDLSFCRRLYETQNVTTVPGRFLARDVDGHNPGKGHIRLSLVADLETTRIALSRLATFLEEGA